MTPERWKQVSQVYESARARPASARAAFLDQACGGDEALREEVQALLDQPTSPPFLEGLTPSAVARAMRPTAGGDLAADFLETPVATLDPGMCLGQYAIGSLIGAGGMGEVYRATDTELGREVAVKVLPRAVIEDARWLARFDREAKTLAALNHPNIAAIYGVEKSGGITALVMELVEGPTLAERLLEGPVPLAEALPIARQIADALEAAHERGIVHRDLKPANVKLRPDGVLKVLDFGLAKMMAQAGVSMPTVTIEPTETGAILGTAAYMSPEQAKGQDADSGADIWAFGVVVFELLTGRRLFAAPSAGETLAAVLHQQPDFGLIPRDVLPQVRTLLRRCLERDQRARLRHIGDARLEIEAALAVVAARGRRADRSRRAAPRRARLGVIHAYQIAPEGMTLNGGYPSASHGISPDGETLAFIVEAEGTRSIWFRPLSSPVARRIAGTEGAEGLFWSPDSRHVGFILADALKRVAVETGQLHTVFEGTDFRGGTWGPDDTILVGSLNRGILRVPAGGGTPVSVTSCEPGESFHYYPHVLPDGRRFLYVIDRPAGVYLGTVDATPSNQGRRMILPGFSNVVYWPGGDGHEGQLLYVRDGALLAQRLDPEAIRLSGSPVTITREVGGSSIEEPSQFSASRTRVLTAAPTTQVALVILSRSGDVTATLPDAGPYVCMRPSPDGQRVALLRATGGREFQLLVVDVRRGTSTRLTRHGGNTPLQAWAPDGAALAYSSDHEGQFRLYIHNLDSTEPRALLPAAQARQFVYDWTRAGIVFGEWASDHQANILFLPWNGDTAPQPLVDSPGYHYDARVSPDGKWLAFVSDDTGRDEVYVQPFPGTGRRERLSVSGGSHPVWDPSGRELYFSSPDGNLFALPVSDEDGSRWGLPHRLLSLRGVNRFRGATYWWPIEGGAGFLVLRTATERNRALSLILNWTDLLP